MTSHRSVLLAALALWASVAPAFRLSGEAQGWLAGSGTPGWYGQAGLGYRPDLAFDIVPRRLDAEVAAGVRAGLEAWGADSLAGAATVRPYRAWLRAGGDRFEARAGLQKLAFGPGVLLRPLQWFDGVDPRDPTGATEGVWGLLGRYWFPGNAAAWAWGLIGNSGRRQWEALESAQWRPEAGTRVQVPVPRGEVGLSFHHRRVIADSAGGNRPAGEERLGADAKFDLGVGLWTEAVVMHERTDFLPAPWQWNGMLGLDYTLGIGNGLGVAVEHLALARAAGMPWDEPAHAGQVSGLLLNYPLGLLDRLSGILLVDWRAGRPYAFVAWQRTLDRWLFQLAGFHGPEGPAAGGGLPAAAGGTGLRLAVVFDH